MVMKRSILFLYLCFSLVTSISAQDTLEVDKPKLKYHHSEIGLNATALVRNLISLGNQNVDTGPYTFSYKYISRNSDIKAIAFRLNMGVNLRNQLTEEFFTDFRNRQTYAAISIGSEGQRRLGKNWVFYSGVDFAFVLDKSEIFGGRDLDELQFSRQAIILGLGPIIGIQVFLNKHISLSTESSYLLKYRMSKNKIESNFYTGGQEQDVQGFEFIFEAPVALYMRFRF